MAIREKVKRDGMWVIHSNDEELSAEDLALAYKQLVRVEDAWKTMKSALHLRPVFLTSPGSAEARKMLKKLKIESPSAVMSTE
ncbi:MAG: hypothetical protein ABIJ35_02565 [Acidobacteriota bacterium]